MESLIKKQSFFEDLGAFCKKVDSEIQSLNETILKPSGSYPHEYNEGIQEFQVQMKELQDLDSDIRSKVNKMGKFSSFAESLSEYVDEHQKDIKRMEEYLEKFGYEVPASRKNIEPTFEKESETDSELSMKDYINTLMLPLSPELSGLSKTILQDPVYENKTSARIPVYQSPMSIRKYRYPSADDLKTPSPQKEIVSRFYTPASVSNKSRCYIQKWLEDVDPEISLTPGLGLSLNSCKRKAVTTQEDFYNTPLPRTKGYTSSFQKKVVDDPRHCTPEEPSLSDFTQSLMKIKAESQKQYTPEEPILSSLAQSVIKKENVNQYTPEEPILSSLTQSVMKKETDSRRQGTPDEPIMSDTTKFLLKNNASPKKREEPILSNTTNTYSNYDSIHQPQISEFGDKECSNSQTPISHRREPQLGHRKILQENSDKFSEEDFLKSPELSDVTKNFLKSLQK